MKLVGERLLILLERAVMKLVEESGYEACWRAVIKFDRERL